eukprot:CAMPEP_0118896610 /NCGR_PEP_ID=MMETSP1166-20130328/4393_1 /TAXON_ID=1104430 /ORGANISM="Chrysoreinhardia sp, Strain CCMP3193" /LENGTH=813 /DNA_ID=CAMNT_0006835669 /DNA_START=22 /DNA_END=2463 /DNA_ORIENTATION=+
MGDLSEAIVIDPMILEDDYDPPSFEEHARRMEQLVKKKASKESSSSSSGDQAATKQGGNSSNGSSGKKKSSSLASSSANNAAAREKETTLCTYAAKRLRSLALLRRASRWPHFQLDAGLRRAYRQELPGRVREALANFTASATKLREKLTRAIRSHIRFIRVVARLGLVPGEFDDRATGGVFLPYRDSHQQDDVRRSLGAGFGEYALLASTGEGPEGQWASELIQPFKASPGTIVDAVVAFVGERLTEAFLGATLEGLSDLELAAAYHAFHPRAIQVEAFARKLERRCVELHYVRLCSSTRRGGSSSSSSTTTTTTTSRGGAGGRSPQATQPCLVSETADPLSGRIAVSMNPLLPWNTILGDGAHTTFDVAVFPCVLRTPYGGDKVAIVAYPLTSRSAASCYADETYYLAKYVTCPEIAAIARRASPRDARNVLESKHVDKPFLGVTQLALAKKCQDDTSFATWVDDMTALLEDQYGKAKTLPENLDEILQHVDSLDDQALFALDKKKLEARRSFSKSPPPPRRLSSSSSSINTTFLERPSSFEHGAGGDGGLGGNNKNNNGKNTTGKNTTKAVLSPDGGASDRKRLYQVSSSVSSILDDADVDMLLRDVDDDLDDGQLTPATKTMAPRGRDLDTATLSARVGRQMTREFNSSDTVATAGPSAPNHSSGLLLSPSSSFEQGCRSFDTVATEPAPPRRPTTDAAAPGGAQHDAGCRSFDDFLPGGVRHPSGAAFNAFAFPSGGPGVRSPQRRRPLPPGESLSPKRTRLTPPPTPNHEAVHVEPAFRTLDMPRAAIDLRHPSRAPLEERYLHSPY